MGIQNQIAAESVRTGRENQGLPDGGGGPDPLGSMVSPSIVFRQC